MRDSDDREGEEGEPSVTGVVADVLSDVKGSESTGKGHGDNVGSGTDPVEGEVEGLVAEDRSPPVPSAPEATLVPLQVDGPPPAPSDDDFSEDEDGGPPPPPAPADEADEEEEFFETSDDFLLPAPRQAELPATSPQGDGEKVDTSTLGGGEPPTTSPLGGGEQTDTSPLGDREPPTTSPLEGGEQHGIPFLGGGEQHGTPPLGGGEQHGTPPLGGGEQHGTLPLGGGEQHGTPPLGGREQPDGSPLTEKPQDKDPLQVTEVQGDKFYSPAPAPAPATSASSKPPEGAPTSDDPFADGSTSLFADDNADLFLGPSQPKVSTNFWGWGWLLGCMCEYSCCPCTTLRALPKRRRPRQSHCLVTKVMTMMMT